MIVKLADNIISPLGVGTQANYRAVKAGLSALKAYPATDLLPEGYFASLFDDKASFEERCIACAEPAIKEAGIDAASDRVIFIISTTKANVELLDGASAGSTTVIAGCDRQSPAAAALQVSRWFGNPNTPVVVSNACISGLAAQIEALRVIESGRCDYAVVIGADVVGRFVISGFQSLKALSPEQCRPFDADRCGLNLGEAAACIIYGAEVPSSPSAPQDDRKEASQDDRVWCAVSGAICNDANHISGPSRTGEGSYRALMAALDCLSQAVIAGSDRQSVVDDVAFINVHGTSTLYNDEMESIAIDRAGLANIPVNTLKGYFGHTLGAAGVLETILSMAAVEDGTVLGTRGFENIGVSRTLKLSSQNAPIEGGKQSFVKLLSGFGGVNAAMLFSRLYKDAVFTNRLNDSALLKIDAPKRSIDFVENSGNQIVKENAPKNLLRAKHNVEITPSRVVLDGAKLNVEAEGPALLEAIYRKYIGDWPKFFKMDPLAKLGFVASELLLQAEGGDRQPTDKRAVILFNRSGSLADDINYQRGIDGPDHLGSPSLFVYTLPNIVTGEIAIRNKYYAETSFYCIPEPDEELMQGIVEESLEPGMSAIAGWCECSSENDFNAKMYILEG
ncbi:MAG: 3-oxoacyl-ACP synthase [Bacteroidales bacterium]|nr:3-oxoacyl-ACP synthase [Bacteroidales bacterium]